MVADQVAGCRDSPSSFRVGLGPPPLDEEGSCDFQAAEFLEQRLLNPRGAVPPAGVLGVEGQGDADVSTTRPGSTGGL
jgi:hypothetical protein